LPIDHLHETDPPRLSRRLASIRLQGFIILVCLAILGLEGWRDWSEHESALEETETQMVNLARSLKQHAEDTFEMTDYALAAVIDLLQADGTSPEALAHLHSILVNRVSLLPRLKEISVYGPDGRWLTSSSQELVPDRTNQSGRDFFIHHRSTLSRRPHFSPPERNRPLGERVMTISRRFSNPDGSFGGVVVAGLDPSYFARFYAQFDIGRNGSISLVSKDGTLLSRVPFTDFVRDGNSPRMVPVGRVSSAPSGAFRFVSPIDGVDRVSGYDSGTYFPFMVFAAMSREEALAGWRSDVMHRGIGIGILVGSIALLGWRLVIQSKRREKAEAKLAVLARTDGLTGLANRRCFDEQLAREWHRSVRDRTPLSLVIVDIDRFKQFNDIYGHQAGDNCLRTVAQALGTVAQRPADLAARYGGEEMVLLLPATDAEGAAKVAERLRSAIETLALPHSGNGPKGVVTVSVGTATLHPGPEALGRRCDSLVSLADHALYDAKRQGRNKVVTASPDSLAA
jgi:diguanylate cyclase (GGDEF) domain